jgi:hypothetical protein
MTEPPEHRGPHRSPFGRWFAAGATLLLALVCLGASSMNGTRPDRPELRSIGSAVVADPPVAGPASGGAVTSGPAATAPVTPVAAVGHSRPVALRIPAIGVSVRLTALGLNPDGTVEVPSDYAQAGWFRLGPTPGETGSAVILGHVDSYRGPAVFYRLRTLRPGDGVEVDLASGATVQFVVTSLVMYPKEEFPGREVYGSHGYSALQLVTCGGTFDTRLRSYRSNVVAYTKLLGVR